MPVLLEGGVAWLSGICTADDAADLADWLSEGGDRVVLDGVTHLHGAVMQCLMAFDVAIEGSLAFPLDTALATRADPVARPAEEHL